MNSHVHVKLVGPGWLLGGRGQIRQAILRGGNRVSVIGLDNVWRSASLDPEDRFQVIIVSTRDEVGSSNVVHPNHYNSVKGAPEVWDILDQFFSDDPLLWNAGKYLLRAGKKGSKLEDLEKLSQYVNRRIEALRESAS